MSIRAVEDFWQGETRIKYLIYRADSPKEDYMRSINKLMDGIMGYNKK